MAYTLVAVPELSGEIFHWKTVVYVAKPLLMPVLLLGFAVITRNHRSFWQLAVGGALVASFFGDVFLMFDGALFFLLGLVSFFFAQAQYIAAFGSRAGRHKGFLDKHPVWALPVVIYLALFLWLLWPNLPDGMYIPVIIYGLALCSMALAAINLFRRIAYPAWVQIMLGALLFMISDSILAINKFAFPLTGAGPVIMATYIVAQWLLVQGAVDTLFINGPTRRKSRLPIQTT